VEEEIGGGADSGSHARRALEYSQEAIDLAKHTQHHLLLANAHLWQGLTQCNSFFDNPEAAREAYDLARASCGANQPDNNMWQHLQTLGANILSQVRSPFSSYSALLLPCSTSADWTQPRRLTNTPVPERNPFGSVSGNQPA